MPRLTNVGGITVSVSDETAALLGSEWVSADAEPKRSPGRPKKSED
jgi:hypothetical protein